VSLSLQAIHGVFDRVCGHPCPANGPGPHLLARHRRLRIPLAGIRLRRRGGKCCHSGRFSAKLTERQVTPTQRPTSTRGSARLQSTSACGQSGDRCFDATAGVPRRAQSRLMHGVLASSEYIYTGSAGSSRDSHHFFLYTEASVYSTSWLSLHNMSPNPKSTEQVATTRAHIPPVTDFGVALDPDVENLLWDSTALARAYGGACK
jgi:hypothetical protein